MKHDVLWKGVLEEVIEDLLHFVAPGIGDEVDLGRGYVFLDKELTEIYGEHPSNRVVDKLVRLCLREGIDRWMLLHLEVQGYYDRDFGRRMFDYYVRLFSKHRQPVAAIAIFTGKEKMPRAYESNFLWMRSRYEFKALRIADYPDEVLKASMNPFAAVVLVAKEAQFKVGESQEDWDRVLLEHKLMIVNSLREKKEIFGERKTGVLMSFLNSYVGFKSPETHRIFNEEVDKITSKKNVMGYFEVLAEMRHEEGVEEGMEKGIEKKKKRKKSQLMVKCK